MNIYEIIAEKENIDEAPVGLLKQVGRKLGAKAAGAVGMKGTAARLQGAADVGDEARELAVAFQGYVGRTGGNPKQIQGPQLAAFLKSQGYPNMHLKGIEGVMTKAQVDKAIMQAAQDAAKADGGTGAPAAGAAPAQTDANKDGKDDKTGKPMKGPQQGGTNVAGKPTTPQVDANKDGKDDKTGEPMQPAAPAAKGATAIPPDLQKQLDALSPTEKKVLAGAL